MNRIPRGWQGLGLMLGLAAGLVLPVLHGCGPVSDPAQVTPQDESNSDQTVTQREDDAVTPPAPAPQTTVQVLFPNGGAQQKIELGSVVNVRVFARNSAVPDPEVEVFWDRDNNYDNGGRTQIGSSFKASAGGIGWDTRTASLGQFYIVARLKGVTPTVYDYSDASFQIVPAGQGSSNPDNPGEETDLIVGVRTPQNNVSLTWGKTYTINWSCSLLPGEGVANVYIEPDFDGDGKPDGQALRTLVGYSNIDASVGKVDFETSGYVGNYYAVVVVNRFEDGQIVTAYSDGLLKIHSPAYWVGELGSKLNSYGQKVTQTGAFQGAVFRGYNFRDNLGSSMAAAGDYDGDGVDEVVIGAQFGKPFLYASGGRGAGEAYLIYGNHQRLYGDYDVNQVGQGTLPGVIFTGILPNRYGSKDVRGFPWAYTVDGQQTDPFATEGLRSITVIPDQDYDGKPELVFSFPWCDSYSLSSQVSDGIHPAPYSMLGRLENDGHFLRGGLVIVSSQNPILTARDATSRHGDRVIMLQEVGQVFQWMSTTAIGARDACPSLFFQASGSPVGGTYGANDTVTYPCDGFWQRTDAANAGGTYGFADLLRIDPPRLADPLPAYELAVPTDAAYACSSTMYEREISINQADPPPVPTSYHYLYARYGNIQMSDTGYCSQTSWQFEQFGFMQVIGTGFYVEPWAPDITPNCGDQRFTQAFEPYGCRILGQTTTQLTTTPPTTANRFGASVSFSGGFLAVGAPMRTALRRDVALLPDNDRFESGEVYLLQMRRPNTPAYDYYWRLPNPPERPPEAPYHDTAGENFSPALPEPHNFIIDDVGYTRFQDGGFGSSDCSHAFSHHGSWNVGGIYYEMANPIRVVGAQRGDRIGDQVQGLYDLNNDGVDDVAIGGAGTNTGRGAVYLIYRRQAEVENDYLLERFQLDASDPDRFNGLMIIGDQGEMLGTALGGLGPAELKDDYNFDGFSDLLIGSPTAATANGFESGEVFILKGGKNLVNQGGGVTISELMAAKAGVLLVGARKGDHAGQTVTNAGDVNGDGIADFMVAAPNATVPDLKFRDPGQDSYRSLRVSFQYDRNGDGVLNNLDNYDRNGDGVIDSDDNPVGIDRDGDGKADPLNDNNLRDPATGEWVYDADDDLTDAGVVYVIFGGTHLSGVISLSEIGTETLPGLVLVGRNAGDEMGGGKTQNGLLSHGVSTAGDLDGDGHADIMVSSVLADPKVEGSQPRTDAGEVYVMYGFAP